jgi:[pyruvate, water dikinase]-phosphate phosphotransferase / [pyruvate, water dikinase] kinase
MIVGLIASVDRIMDIRRNRLSMLSKKDLEGYTDRHIIAAELNESKALFLRNNWNMIDVTRRSVEETAAQIIKLLHDRDEADQEQRETGDG